MMSQCFGSAPRWEDLPTQLIRAVGELIGFEPWVEVTVRQLRNGDRATGRVLYGFLLHYLDHCKQVYNIPLDLSLDAPLSFSVGSLAKILVRITILIKDGGKPAKDRRSPEQLAQQSTGLYELLCNLDAFLCGVEQYLNSGESSGVFYGHIAYQLLMPTEDILSSDQIRAVNVFLVAHPASVGNFEVSFIYEIRKAVEAGEELSDEKIQRMADRAAAVSNLVTRCAHNQKDSLAN